MVRSSGFGSQVSRLNQVVRCVGIPYKAVAVVVPVRNEARRLPALLRHLQACPGITELIVVDGGSDDDSCAVAQALGARVVLAPRAGRGVQLDLGARAARAPAVLFVHADTVLPHDAARRIAAALADPRCAGGAFRRRFVPSDWWLALTTRLGDLRVAFTGISFGDQAQFVRRSAYLASGGFRDLDRAEDMDLARRLRALGQMRLLGPPVRSSARRFARGSLGTSLRDAWLTLRLWRQTAPQSCATPATES
jgi:rSAM/selenodomain-associated transferase 2